MEIGIVQQVDIDQQLRASYLDYAMSVIVARALPDARDGLKPVHRRILYAMHDMGLRPASPYRKSARIVGEVLGKYHPHGDAAVYEAMARMAQDFSMRYTLVDGQGNFGSIDGDAPAAMRYTEARLQPMAEELLVDIEQETVDFAENFDGSLPEPEVLPARLPNLLLNGSSGIAVGMATNLPPHNLREIVAALTYLIDEYDRVDEVAMEDLLQFVPGPDFPTGGTIIGNEGIRQAYATGHGRIVLRGVAHIEEMGASRHRIVITEIPFQLNKSTLVERIAELARGGKLDDISDLRDESDRRGMSIIVELKRGAQPKKVLNQLYKYTPLQSTFGAQMLALVEGAPRLITLKRGLQIFIEHRREVIARRSRHQLAKARARAHILEGLLIALAHLDDVIQTIRQSPDAEAAKERLMERFTLSEKQALAILDMQLRRLAALERQKIEDEQRETLERIAFLEDLLEHPKKILGVIKDDLVELGNTYGDERRTRIAAEATEELQQEDLVVDEQVLVSLTQRGFVKRIAARAYRTKGRSGQALSARGVSAHATRDEDEVVFLFPARTLDTILFFSDRGRVYSEKGYQIPDVDRSGRGIPIANVLSLEARETVTAAVAVSARNQAEYCVLATRQGRVKRMALSEFSSVRPSGINAIKLEPGDELGWVRLTHGKDEILLVTENGQVLRFSEESVRPMGRTAGGVTGMRLAKGDFVASMEVVEAGGALLIATARGFLKRTALDEYPAKGRGTGGVATIPRETLEKTGRISAARVVQPADSVTLITSNGLIYRARVNDISQSGRARRAARLVELPDGDSLASLARIAVADLRSAGVSPSGEPAAAGEAEG